MNFKTIEVSDFARTVLAEHGHRVRRWVKVIITENDHPDYDRVNGRIITKCTRCGTIFETNGDAVFVKVNGRWVATYARSPEYMYGYINDRVIHDATCDELIIYGVIT